MSDAPIRPTIYHRFDAHGQVLGVEWDCIPDHIHVHREVLAQPLAHDEILKRGYRLEHGNEGEEIVGMTRQ